MFDYAVLGLGKTGCAALEYLVRREPAARILASDAKADPALEEQLKRQFPGVAFEFGGHTERVAQARQIIKSPGLKSQHPILKRAREAGAIVMSEIEFAFRRFPAQPRFIVGVTGTNGKTTTTHLSGRLFEAGGFQTLVAGNIGAPLIGSLGSIHPDTVLVLELSSYQLEDSRELALDAGLVMNITPDHLEHHGDWAAYLAAKEKIFRFVKPGGWEIVNADDAAVRNLAPGPAGIRLSFSSKQALEEGAWLSGGKLQFAVGHSKVNIRCSAAPCPNLIGVHNLENQMAAILSALIGGVRPAAVEQALTMYAPPPHRLEKVTEIGGILFINDSKATNIDSTVVALRAIGPLAAARRGKIHLLLGGQDKGSPYAPIADFAPAIKKIYAYGEARGKIVEELKALPGEAYPDLPAAVRDAVTQIGTGDIVLLSPACASFDQFKNFEHRGERFREIVARLLGPRSGR
ncbi:MAG: UDP-N-acetylmuramoyl-L-alanine--D-glutamate ligase [Elusimicrobia bacterium]|nr:UDP-N-acetylmuramoyl-L-alanine--D-glutamate ligase [Elusimicrobiota bacterium]